MRYRYLIGLAVCVLMIGLMITGCGGNSGEPGPEGTGESQTEATAEKASEEETTAEEAAEVPTLLYMGHASIRITTGEDKVVYIDPYAGEGYDLPADLILVTHDHYDHSAIDLIEERNEDCTVITQTEALKEGSFDLGYVSIEAVEAGNNEYHSISECVGYILTFSNGRKVYVTGDTSKTDQMAELADRNIDYAFFCCDGKFNMDLEEAAECAELVQAKHNIPYHIVEADHPDQFDLNRAEEFPAPNKMIVQPGEEIKIE